MTNAPHVMSQDEAEDVVMDFLTTATVVDARALSRAADLRLMHGQVRHAKVGETEVEIRKDARDGRIHVKIVLAGQPAREGALPVVRE